MRMRYLPVVIVAVILSASCLFAQIYMGDMPREGSVGSTQMVYSSHGLLVLRTGVLAKYNPQTLQEVQVFELFGPAPESPEDSTDRAGQQAYFAEMQRRMAPALMLTHEDSLLIIVGNGFARIDQETLKVEATADLTMPEEGEGTESGRDLSWAQPAPTYLLVGQTIYLTRSNEVLALDVTEGKILGRTPLPEEMQSAPMSGFMGMRGGLRGVERDFGPRGGFDRGGPTPQMPPTR